MATRKKDSLIGKAVVVRDHMAGVIFGVLEEFDPVAKTARLSGSRKIHCWTGAAAVDGISVHGISYDGSRVCPIVESRWCCSVVEVLGCEHEAAKNLRAAPVWRP